MKTGIRTLQKVEKRRSKKHLATLDKYVIFSITTTLVYTIAEFVTSTITGISHDTLSTCVYGFFAGEIVVAGLIKIFKLRRE